MRPGMLTQVQHVPVPGRTLVVEPGDHRVEVRVDLRRQLELDGGRGAAEEQGIEADVDRCRAYAESGPSLGTSLNPYIGYERASEVVKESVKSGRSVRDIVVEQGLLTEEEVDRALDVLGMTRGGVRR